MSDELQQQTEREFDWWYARRVRAVEADYDPSLDKGEPIVSRARLNSAYSGMTLERAKEARDELDELIERLEAMDDE